MRAGTKWSHAKRAQTRRTGFTLLEVLIATAVTLLMMVSLAQIFKVIGDSMKQGRAALELNNRLRSVTSRVKADLENLTVIPAPPLTPASGTGYLKIFDGALTDNTAAGLPVDPTLPAAANASRFGDVDDIFMGTVRAGDTWFTGKVPRYVLTRTDPVLPEDYSLVTIAAQHAEVVAFMQPLVTNVGNPSRDPAFFLTASPAGAVAFQDIDGVLGFPDGFKLHYRTKLIRPDLNLPSALVISSLGITAPAGVLAPAQAQNAAGQNVNWLTANPPGGGLPTPMCDMAAAHQQCDLSMRRVVSGNGTFDYVSANSLEDLTNPANRFAHFQAPLSGTAATMPLLALGPSLVASSLDPNGNLTSNVFQVGAGFLHPAYALYGSRAGEDVLGADVLAFDIKGFDPGVPLLASVGPDGGAGVFGVDDNGIGGMDDALELGWAGSDDLVLSPNDPGYAAVLGSAPIGTGDYVDIGWAHKLRNTVLLAGGSLPAGANLWSQLSGYSETNFAASSGASPFTDTLYKSGLVRHAGMVTTTNLPQIMQLSYDTWNSRYEGDGNLQAELAGAVRGLVSVTDLSGGGPALLNAAFRGVPGGYIVDAGTDGVDNNAVGGIDEPAELETSPPFPVDLRGIKISIRMEDPASRQVRQMSVAKEFVTQ